MNSGEHQEARTGRWNRTAQAAIIILLAVIAYLPATRGGFVWDDDAHVTRPELQSGQGLARIWFEVGATQQYYPVLHTAFWLEHRLWADAPEPYHWLNVLLHATAACLFAAVLRRVGVPRAWLGGAIFAVHPVCVESVAWISEQKNTLSAVFYLAAATVYLAWKESAAGQFSRRGSPGRLAGSSRYWLAIALFGFALLTKSVTATLPAALLLVTWWRRGRLSWRDDVAPLAPWLVLGLAAGMFTAWVERVFIIGPAAVALDLDFGARCLLAGRAVWFYLGKLAWPADLAFIYPRWEVGAWSWAQSLFPMSLVLLVGGLGWMAVRGRRGPLTALLYFCGTLFPALGFVDAYPFVFSYVADHFQYLACLGPIALLVAAADEVPRRWSGAVLGYGRLAGAGAVAGAIGVLGALTWRQCGDYRDARTLYEATLKLNPDCWLAHHNLGNLLLDEGRADEAIGHYAAALRPNPGNADIHFNLGRALLQEKRDAESASEFQIVVRQNPADAEARDNLGSALLHLGRAAEAVTQITIATRLSPANGIAHYNLGAALQALGRTDEAQAEFATAARLGVHP